MIRVRKLQLINDNTERDGLIEHTLNSKKLVAINMKPIQPASISPASKLTILRNKTSSDAVITKNKKLQLSTTVKPEAYEQRKRMLLEYKELFAALMRLPDIEIQKKLLDVINNHHLIEHRTVATQTDPVEFIQRGENIIDTLSSHTSTHYNKSENGHSSIKESVSGEILKKRTRKRKVSLPQAHKESRTKQLAKMNKPKTANWNNISTTSNKIETQAIIPAKRQRCNSFSISECSSDVVNIYEDTETHHEKDIEQCSLLLENGLLPIQDAVIRNQTNKLNMHILKWQSYRGTDLNDILTEEDEDLLQLAVLNTCDPSIVSLLLKKGLDPNSLDPDSNTIIHLAILNDITIESLDHLMKHIDLKLLLTLNDDGYTPLHLAIRQDRYLLAERLITVLDERLVNTIFYKRPVDELETDETVLKQQFKNYYEKVCQQIALDKETDACSVENHDLKQKLLQTGDRKSGSTALYFAIDNRSEHLIYFLLAHLTDPRTENFSGLDCKTYFCENGKALNLSINVENTMEKVIELLS